MFATLKDWARRIRRDIIALYLVARDPRTPWHVKIAAACVAAYALNPIDLIPDFIPVLGYLDDLIIVPIGIWLVVRLTPPELMSELRAKAAQMDVRPKSRAGALFVAAIWLAAGALVLWWLRPVRAA
ncbi:DUF1232 domain-containing protein [Mesorhizobium sp. YR577]|uniref:YkvA family protein n=1 Tax=Mesorhizobium sp. YR577 TaxID=1884373 RepID=UPI0008E92270|nr:DUF1232 domain-containing protein [Mesorhizobium sp. YR577]SFU22145.1 Uncharacterized membrane protein YkvA, DUF1232 family [Mesorhizobium sp. YR577]